MPCYQSTNLPGGVTTSGRTAYQTEADCLQACKEGACCEGTTCSVKPQCQCQGTGKVFKGVGTTCTPNPCISCPPILTNQNLSNRGMSLMWCKCFCGEGLAAYPRFVNVNIVGEYAVRRQLSPRTGPDAEFKKKSFNTTLTLTGGVSNSYSPGSVCSWGIGRVPLNSQGGEVTLDITATSHEQPVATSNIPNSAILYFGITVFDYSEYVNYFTDGWVADGAVQGVAALGNISGSLPSSSYPLAGPITSGVCFSSAAGGSMTSWSDPSVQSVPVDLDECRLTKTNTAGGSPLVRVRVTFAGFQQ